MKWSSTGSLQEKYLTSTFVEAVPRGTTLGITSYLYISHQICNKREEYTKLRDAVNDIAFKSLVSFFSIVVNSFQALFE